jgi:circadian clock protein KaiB
MQKEYILKLYVIGTNPASEQALRNIKEIIAQDTGSRFQLKVIDLRNNPQLAEKDKILAIPTLIREQPLPLKKIIGDLSDREKVLQGLEIISRIKK